MTESEPVRQLDAEECWEELRTAPIGRLALSAAGEIDIFPITFIVHDEALYFRTAPGTKLLELTVNDHVALEVDRFDEGSAHSVVVKGHAERVEAQSEIDAAESYGLEPWVPTLKYRWVRILPRELSGREFLRGPEPERF